MLQKPLNVINFKPHTNEDNDIIPLLSDVWLDENEKQMKKTLKTMILETVPAKCDI